MASLCIGEGWENSITVTSTSPSSKDVHVSTDENNPADADNDATNKRNPNNNDVIELLSDEDDGDDSEEGDNNMKATPLCDTHAPAHPSPSWAITILSGLL